MRGGSWAAISAEITGQAEIERLEADLADARAENERLREASEVMALAIRRFHDDTVYWGMDLDAGCWIYSGPEMGHREIGTRMSPVELVVLRWAVRHGE